MAYQFVILVKIVNIINIGIVTRTVIIIIIIKETTQFVCHLSSMKPSFI